MLLCAALATSACALRGVDPAQVSSFVFSGVVSHRFRLPAICHALVLERNYSSATQSALGVGFQLDLKYTYEHTSKNKWDWHHRTGQHTIPYSYVNDDFCDCFDGADEPGTSACGGGRFWCPNHVTGSGKYIAASRVYDGVCDCCNGADETKLTCPDVCNEAASAWRSEMQRRLAGFQQRKEYIRNGQLMLVTYKTGETEVQKQESEVARWTEQLSIEDGIRVKERAHLREAALQLLVEALQITGSSSSLLVARVALDQGEAATQALIELLTEGRDAHQCDGWSSELALALARAGPESRMGGRCSCLGCKTRKRMAEAEECGPKQKCSAVPKPWECYGRAEDDHNLQVTCQCKSGEIADRSDPPACIGGSFSSCVGNCNQQVLSVPVPHPSLMPARVQSTGTSRQHRITCITACRVGCSDHSQHSDRPEWDLDSVRTMELRDALCLGGDGPGAEQLLIDFVRTTEQVGLLCKMLSRLKPQTAQVSGTGTVTIGKSLDSNRFSTAVGAFKNSAIALVQFKHRGYEEAQAQLARASEEARKAKETAGQDQDITKIDFGSESELATLYKKCFEKTEGTYKYKMCLFDMAMQGSTSLGTFRSWSASGAAPDMQAGRPGGRYGRMTFEGGDSWQCPERRARRCDVVFQCGETDELLTVSEHSPCEYEMVFETPAACTLAVLPPGTVT